MEYFPTQFAMQLGRTIGICPELSIEEIICKCETGKKKERKVAEQMKQQHGRLSSFQGLCATGTFKDSMLAYEGYELNKGQKKVLKKIHKSTRIWVKGDIVGKILEQLKSTTASKSIKELSETAMDIMEPEGKEGGASGQKFKALVIQTYTDS